MTSTTPAGNGAALRSAIAGLGAGLVLVGAVYVLTVTFATDPLTVLAGFVGVTWLVGVGWIVVTAIDAARSEPSASETTDEAPTTAASVEPPAKAGADPDGGDGAERNSAAVDGSGVDDSGADSSEDDAVPEPDLEPPR